MSYFIVPGSNRYFLNDAQRQQLIDEEIQCLLRDDWTQSEVNDHQVWLKELANKELVEQVCGCQWAGFIGQTLKSA
jgi:hypothetical protein